MPRTKLALAILLLLHVGSASAKEPAIPNPYLLLIRDSFVHKEVGLTNQQIQSLRKITDKVDVNFWPLRHFGPAQNGGKVQKLINSTKTQVQNVLSRQQSLRLEQIVLRSQGIKCLLRKDVAQLIKMTPAQRTKSVAAIEKLESELAGFYKQVQAGKPRAPLEKKAAELRQSTQKQLLALLKPTQKNSLGRLLGKQLDMTRIGQNLRYKAPEFATGNTWISTKPLTMRQLRGKVVIVYFYAFG